MPRQPAPVPTPDDLPVREPEVRIGLVVDTAQIELAAARGLQVLSAGGREIARTGPGEAALVTAGADGLHLRVGERTVPLERTAVVRAEGGELIRVGGKPYRGSVLLRSTPSGRLTVINQVDLETYLLGVVPKEIGRVGPELLEAAKAQAVAARTYTVAHLGRRESLGFDLYATVQDQVYGGAEAEFDPVSEAVRTTAGEILTYQGEPIEAYYHSTCAGRTAAIEEVWNAPPRPYLVSVVDVDPRTGEAFDRASSRFEWTVRWSADELERILSRTLADSLPAGVSTIGRLRDLRVEERTPSGRVRALRIRSDAGDFVVGKDRVRWIFLTPEGRILNSSLFDLEVVRTPSGNVAQVIARGGGWGHGIGMCQVGAMGRARAGQNYRTILETYYPGARLRDLY